ncbi:unnamed protein product [Pleuronectes platessa]|uniref:Uncharacterized protein n=1 Tax=Pleuronectes platessa TaxID=8262 RepID=A0A9N7TY42_PLEPL|nr:unnamed protein product [Pleuronectes platessa]
MVQSQTEQDPVCVVWDRKPRRPDRHNKIRLAHSSQKCQLPPPMQSSLGEVSDFKPTRDTKEAEYLDLGRFPPVGIRQVPIGLACLQKRRPVQSFDFLHHLLPVGFEPTSSPARVEALRVVPMDTKQLAGIQNRTWRVACSQALGAGKSEDDRGS